MRTVSVIIFSTLQSSCGTGTSRSGHGIEFKVVALEWEDNLWIPDIGTSNISFRLPYLGILDGSVSIL